MAPVRSKNPKSPKTGNKGASSAKSSFSKSKKSSGVPRPTPKQVKTKPGSQSQSIVKPKKKKERVYTEKELGLPALNMITPAGVTKPRGKKKGKVFVDDPESMMTILAMVNAEKEGQIESKIMKARQMEEIREAKRKEAEAKQELRKEKLESVKDSLKKKKNKSKNGDVMANRVDDEEVNGTSRSAKSKSGKKRVSFA